MGDNAELLAQLVASSQKQEERFNALLQAFNNKQPPPVEYRPAAPDAAEIRAEKVQKINLDIRKSNHLKKV